MVFILNAPCFQYTSDMNRGRMADLCQGVFHFQMGAHIPIFSTLLKEETNVVLLLRTLWKIEQYD